jgi:hypothetical protein
MPGLYFETKKLNPTPYHSLLMINQQTEKQLAEVRELLDKRQPSCAILDYEAVKKFNYNKNNPVDNYILNNYRLVFQKDNVLVYKIIK